MRIIVLEGNEKYLPLAKQLEPLLLESQLRASYMLDGESNCGEVAAFAFTCATAAGHKARLLRGKVYRHDGRLDFADGGHCWVKLADGTVIDGSGADRIRIHNPEQTGERFISILSNNNRRPLMRNAKYLRPIIDAIQTGLRAEAA